MAHAAWTPGPINVSKWDERGVNISYSAESGNPKQDRPERFLHFDVQTRTAKDPLPDQLEPAVIGGRRGRLAPASDRRYFGEPYFANHVRFFWREGGTRFAATLHNFGRGTRAVLDALVERLQPPAALETDPRPIGEQVDLIPVPVPSPVAVAATGDEIWVAGKGGDGHIQWPEILPIDLDTGRPTDDPVEINDFLGSPALATAADGLWVAHPARSDRQALQLLNPRSAQFTRSITVGPELTAVAATRQEVWTVDLGGFPDDRDYRGGAVDRFDAQSGEAVAHTQVGRAPAGIAVADGEGSAWVTNSLDDTVSRIDLESNRVTESFPVCAAPIGVEFGYGSVWVACQGADAVARIDPDDGGVTEIAVGDSPRGVAVGEAGVWVTNNLADTVSRIAPESGRVVETVPVGTGPAGIVVAHGAVWVASTSADAVSRIEP